jgi:hypothetical protein
MKNTAFQQWLMTRPISVQRLAKKYPPGKYRIKTGAPYGISCPGTIVELHSYTEHGEVGVIVRAVEKLPHALVHERTLQEQHGNADPHHGKDFLVHIDPTWMEPVSTHADPDHAQAS